MEAKPGAKRPAPAQPEAGPTAWVGTNSASDVEGDDAPGACEAGPVQQRYAPTVPSLARLSEPFAGRRV